MILVTGGAGFIGSNFVLRWIAEEKAGVINYDKLTTAGNLNNLSFLMHNNALQFIQGDIRNRGLLHETLKKHQPVAIVNCAAETHIERSSSHPEHYINTNLVGTFDLLEETHAYWKQLDSEQQKRFRFLHISSDEVYGPAPSNAAPVKESTALNPANLYATSKAAADHLVQAYYINHKLPTLIARSPNNFGPNQFPEKLIPYTIVNALQQESVPLYGEGLTVRSWLYVWDHCAALRLLLTRGIPGEVYNIGAQAMLTNKDVVEAVCRIMDELKPEQQSHSKLIKFIKDKPPHDIRYPLDSSKLQALGWQPRESFEESLKRTVHWYLQNMPWVENVVSGEYRDWIHATAMSNE